MRVASGVIPALLAGLLAGLSTVSLGAVPVAASPAAVARAGTGLGIEAGAARSGEDAPLGIVLADPNGVPVAGVEVLVERRVAGGWQPLAILVTDAAGRAGTVLRLGTVRADNIVRASYAGDAAHAAAASGEVQVELVRRASKLRLTGPGRVVDNGPLP